MTIGANSGTARKRRRRKLQRTELSPEKTQEGKLMSCHRRRRRRGNSSCSCGRLGLPKENKKPLEFKLHSGERAVKRAMFNYSVATNYYITKLQKKQEDKLQKMIEEEDIRMLRKEMVPKARLMPFFDRPFLPQRSSIPLTMPKEPSFGNVNSTCWTCVFNNQYYLYHIHHVHA
ncbi:TPX2 protein [Raphanus sativus]|nr:TPX2 protein [Raphanus sativus]